MITRNLCASRTVFSVLCGGLMALAAHAQTTPTVTTGKATYDPREPISVTFANGPGNAKDWVGIYFQGQTPSSSVPSIYYLYVDGTQAGTDPQTGGTLTFPGLSQAGSYSAFLLENDGYTALASTTFTVAVKPFVLPDHDMYYPDEPISVQFGNGPGNPKDWIGVYMDGQTPGGPESTIWNYVDNTQNGNTGLKEGVVTFPSGLAIAGDWDVFFLLNDGYTILSSNLFKIVDPSTPIVHVDKREYLKGENINVAFTNGPANPKDWIGIYRADAVPSASAALILWKYVDGTGNGNTGVANGVIPFAGGLDAGGEYVAYLLENDGYNPLASEAFTVLNASSSPAKIVSTTPSDASSNLPPVFTFSAKLVNGTTKVDTNTITLKLDGTTVPVQITVDGENTIVQSSSPELPAPNSDHIYQLSFKDNGTPANTITSDIHFKIANYKNVVLPTPIYFENFDAVPEGQLPAGWTEQNFTDVQNPDVDFGNLDSAAYKTWTAVDADRFKGSFVTYSNPDNPQEWEDDYHRVLTPNPFNVLNGKVYTNALASGRFLFSDSGYRNGTAQIAYLFTPDFDLSGKTNVYLSFHSLWEQNQDSSASVEYSIDQGQTWLPIVYMIDPSDVTLVTNTDGSTSIDAVATLTADHGDVAHYADPNTGEDKGGNYGAFIGAQISPALAPFISPRVNDDPAESKRIELFRLPAADNQAKVRFRFAQDGTDSWYFGIDDFGLYSIGESSGAAPTLNVSKAAGNLTIQWDPTVTGYTLEGSTSLSSPNWQAVPGVINNSVTIPTDGAARFFRLRKP